MKKKMQITVERERLLVITRSDRVRIDWCENCCAEVNLLSVEEAAALCGISQRRIFGLAEKGALHFKETAEGQALFCFQSLTRQEFFAM